MGGLADIPKTKPGNIDCNGRCYYFVLILLIWSGMLYKKSTLDTIEYLMETNVLGYFICFLTCDSFCFLPMLRTSDTNYSFMRSFSIFIFLDGKILTGWLWRLLPWA